MGIDNVRVGYIKGTGEKKSCKEAGMASESKKKREKNETPFP